ncbi:MAG: HAD family hydrolase [Eubacterium sp.]
MTVKMIVTDLDGTLLNTENKISQENRNAFKEAKKKGIIPVVATGRVDKEGWFAAEAIDATAYMLSGNGGVVKDYVKDITVFEDALSREIIAHFLEIIEGFDNIFVQAQTRDGCVCTSKSHLVMPNAGWAEDYVKKFYDQQIVVENLMDYLTVKKLPVNKFVVSSNDFKKLDNIQEKLALIKGAAALRPMDYCLECIPEEVDKGLGLTKLCEYLGIALEEVMVIGDSDNDVEMLEIAGVKIAMGNGYDCVKNIADYIVGINDEHGVAEAILKYAL